MKHPSKFNSREIKCMGVCVGNEAELAASNYCRLLPTVKKTHTQNPAQTDHYNRRDYIVICSIIVYLHILCSHWFKKVLDLSQDKYNGHLHTGTRVYDFPMWRNESLPTAERKIHQSLNHSNRGAPLT